MATNTGMTTARIHIPITSPHVDEVIRARAKVIPSTFQVKVISNKWLKIIYKMKLLWLTINKANIQFNGTLKRAGSRKMKTIIMTKATNKLITHSSRWVYITCAASLLKFNKKNLFNCNLRQKMIDDWWIEWTLTIEREHFEVKLIPQTTQIPNRILSGIFFDVVSIVHLVYLHRTF